MVQVPVTLGGADGIRRDLYRLACDIQAINRFGGGEEWCVWPYFSHNDRGDYFYAALKVWPGGGFTRRRLGDEWTTLWSDRNHITIFYLKSIRARVFQDKRVTDRLKAMLHHELDFSRCEIFQQPADYRVRVAFGEIADPPGGVYSQIRRSADSRRCVVQVITRILKCVSMFLLDHGYMPVDVELQTVTLHMQWHPGQGHWALKFCFEAWAADASAESLLRRNAMRAAASPPVVVTAFPMPTRPCPGLEVYSSILDL